MWGPLLATVDNAASHPETWDFLAAMVEATDAKVTVEAGTYRGHGTFAMAEACFLRGTGHVWSADVEDHGVWDVLCDTGLSAHTTLYIGRFENMLGMVPSPIDLAFIDASELATPLLRVEYVDMVLSRLSPHGVCIVDDCTDDAWEGAKMLRDRASLYLPLGHGLVVIQK